MHDIIYPLITVRPLCYNTSVAPSQPPFSRHPGRQRRQKIRHDRPKPSSRQAQQRDKTGLPTLLQMGKNRSGPHTDALGILALPLPSATLGSVRSFRARSLPSRSLPPRARSIRALDPSARSLPLNALSLNAALVPSPRSLLTLPLAARFPPRAHLRTLPSARSPSRARSPSCAPASPSYAPLHALFICQLSLIPCLEITLYHHTFI